MNSRMNITCDKKPCYDIVFSADFDDLITELSGFHIAERKVAVITDTNVKKLYGEQILALLDGNCKKAFFMPLRQEKSIKHWIRSKIFTAF